MFKSKRGSITMLAFAALLLFSMYGIVIYSNSARSYIIQGRAIDNIKKAYYNEDINMKQLYNEVGNIL